MSATPLNEKKPGFDVDSIFEPNGENEYIYVPPQILNTTVGKLASELAATVEMPVGSAFLIVLATASGTAALNFKTEFRTGFSLPIGIYAVAESMPSVQKSRIINTPKDRHQELIHQHNKWIREQNDNSEHDLPEALNVSTDPTAAGLDRDLSTSDSGRAFIAAAEKGAFSSLFPRDGSYSSNNDIVLAGWSGDFTSASRKGRSTFSGYPQISIAIFAQAGSIGRVLKESNGSGLAERFLFAAEPDNLGNRIFPHVHVDPDGFNEAVEHCYELFKQRITVDDGGPVIRTGLKQLQAVRPTPAGYDMIRQERLNIEPWLGQLKKSGEMTLIGWLGKLESHVLKIAATLHVFDAVGTKHDVTTIPDDTIRASITFFRDLAAHYQALLHDNGESGQSAEYEVILNALRDMKRPPTLRDLCLVCKNQSPFRSMGKKAYRAVKAVAQDMLSKGVLEYDDEVRLHAVG